MANKHAALRYQFVSSTGAGPLTLGSAVDGFQALGAAHDGLTLPYTLREGLSFEWGTGVYTHAPGVLTRNVQESSNSNSAIILTGNAPRVAIGLPDPRDLDAAAAITEVFERSGVSLRPKSNNTYDIGSSSNRVRQGHFQSLYIGGQATQAFTNLDKLGIITNAGSIADNVSDIAELDADLASLEAVPKVGHTGLAISRTSDTILSVNKGHIQNHLANKMISVTSPIALDTSLSGSFVNGSVRANNTWYHVLVGHLTSDGSVVAGLSTSLSKPSAWDDWQMVGAMRTNGTGSGNWDLFVQDGDWFFQPLEIQQYSVTTQGTGETGVRCWCPPGSYRVKNFLRASNSTAGFYCLIRQVPAGAWWLAPHVITGRYVNVEFDMVTDSLGNFYFANTASANFDIFSFTGRAFRYTIGNAANA